MEQTLNPRLFIIHSTQGSRYQNPIELSKVTRILSSLGVKACHTPKKGTSINPKPEKPNY
jgi:hypothetical protein